MLFEKLSSSLWAIADPPESRWDLLDLLPFAKLLRQNYLTRGSFYHFLINGLWIDDITIKLLIQIIYQEKTIKWMA